jgi:Holliday junction resolvase RusA-like endonuclease
MMEPITVVIPGEPQGKARARFGKSGVYTPAKTVAYEDAIGMLAKASMRGKEQLSGPLHVDMRAVVKIPRSWSVRKQQAALLGEIRPTSKPDIDNILKAIADGMNGIVYRDDAAIVSANVSKVYGHQCFVAVTIKCVPHRVPETTQIGASNVGSADRG